MPSELLTEEIDVILEKAKADTSLPGSSGTSKIVASLTGGLIGLILALLATYFGWLTAMAFVVIVFLAAWIFKKLR